MRKLWIGAIITTLFTITGTSCSATVDSVGDDGTYTVGPSGSVK